LRIRIGLHTGEAEEYEGGYFGPAVNVAVRLAAAGHGGQTLLSGAVAGLLENTALRDLGWYRLDDVVAEQHLFQLGDVECPPLRLEDRFRGNLPRGLGTPIGRNSELEAVAAALAAYPVVTLVGPGGIGKTTVALAAAGRIETAGDSWLIELAEVDTVQHVVRAIADTLGVKERHGATLTRSIVETLQSRQALLILDNCEHVVDAAADFATAATRGCEGVRVLATSRERLGLTSERIINIPPLDPAGTAVELFAERAVAVASGFDAAAERSVVEEICRRLDGVPLAIELAAAHMASLTADELASLLGRHLQILDGTRRGGLDRHRTLRAAIQWSHDLLAPVERALFARLSIFTGSFDLDAVEWVGAFEAADAVQVAGALSRLVEQSMVHVESGPFGRRFRLLEPIRQYGRECLAGVGEAAAVAARHAKWCHCEVTGVYNLISGWGEIEGVARLAELWPNLRAAFDWACGAGDLDLARDLMRPILSEVVVRSNNEIGDWAEQLLELTPIEDEAGLVFGLYAAAHRYSMSQDPAAYEALVARYREPDHVLMHHARAIAYEDYEMMAEWAPRAAEEFRRQGDDLLAERGDLYLAGALMNLGRFEEGDAILEQLLARYRDQGPPTFINWTLLLLGYSAVFQGRRDDADAYFDEGVAVEVPPRTHTPSRPLEARAAFRRGNHLRAYRILQAHLDELLVTDNMQAGVIDCIEFVNMMAEVGRTEEAAKVLAHLEATGIFEAPGWWSLVATAAEVIAGSEGVGDPEDHDALDDDRAALEYVRAVIGEVADD
jgi:predicted ATPase